MMTTSAFETSFKPLALVLLVGAAALLAGCQTAGGPLASAAPQPPMTRARAASECWMQTEKGGASMNLDKRADIVTKCIDEKMKVAQAGKEANAKPAEGRR